MANNKRIYLCLAHMSEAGLEQKYIKEAEDPATMRAQKIEEYKEKFANPYVAAGYGYVDAVINPDETRQYLIQALEIAKGKKVEVIKKKHGVPPF